MTLSRLGLAILSFVVYAGAVLLLDPAETSQWGPERTDALPAAISFSVYGDPLGTVEPDIWGPMRQQTSETVQDAVRRFAAGPIERFDLMRTATDGNGIGWLVFSSLSMKLLGPRLSSLTTMFLVLFGLTTLAFVARFRDQRLFVVPVFFFTLTLLLFTPFTSLVMHEMAIGGIRYFAIFAILPALHIYFELADRAKLTYIHGPGNLPLLAFQVMAMTLAIFVRTSSSYVLAPIAIQAALNVQASWSSQTAREYVLDKIGSFCVLVVASSALMIAIVVPDYVTSGRLNPGVWHRAFIGLGANPAWPFPGVRDHFDCSAEKFQNGGLRAGIMDANGHCIWVLYEDKRGHPASGFDLHSGEYQKPLREAFFYVVLNYPREALATFLYYKPLMILSTLRDSARFDFSGARRQLVPLLAVQIAILIAFVGLGAAPSIEAETKVAIRALATFMLFSIPTYLLAWSNLHTSIDIVFYTYSIVTVILAFFVRKLFTRVRVRLLKPQH